MLKQSFSLEDKYTAEEGRVFLSGTQALRFNQHPINRRRGGLAEIHLMRLLEVGIPARMVGVLEIHFAVEKFAEQASYRQRLINKNVALVRGKGIQQLTPITLILALLHIGVGHVRLQLHANLEGCGVRLR